MEQHKPPRKPSARFTPARRAAALRVMGETGNKRAAAEAAGVDPSTIDLWLRKDAGFAADWAAMAAAVDRRLAAARSPSEGVADGSFETIRRSRTGRLQIQAVRQGRWTKAVEDRFFAALRTCGNVAACARLVGFSEKAIWDRRDKWPAFAERMEKAMEEAEVALEFRLACLGNNVGVGLEEDEEPETGSPTPGPADGALGPCRGHGPPSALSGRGDEEIPFDPEFALKFLKWREEKRRGRAGARGAARQKPATKEEVIAALQKNFGILRKRHLAQGWSEDESGHLIPPGWVRKDPPSPEAPADDPPSR